MKRGSEMAGFQLTLICLLFAAVSAKWAMELGFRQGSQILWAILGFFAGPIAVLILYVRLVTKCNVEGQPGGRW
jgi:hypothetical protein